MPAAWCCVMRSTPWLAWSRWLGVAALAAVLCFHAGPVRAELPAAADAATLLAQARAARTTDHPRFLQLLQQLHLRRDSLSSEQQWGLRLLDAWQASFEGDYAKAEPLLRAVAAHPGDLDRQSLANGMLLNLLAIRRQYEEAFTLAEQLGLKAGQLFRQIRVAVTGRMESPGFFDTLRVIGIDRVRRRIKNAIALLGE